MLPIAVESAVVTGPSGYTCTSNPSLSDEEQAAEMSRCADAFDAGGWGPNNGNQSRYCDLLGDCRLAYGYPVDFGVESRSGQPSSLFGVPLSLAQQYALDQYNGMVGRTIDSVRNPVWTFGETYPFEIEVVGRRDSFLERISLVASGGAAFLIGGHASVEFPFEQGAEPSINVAGIGMAGVPAFEGGGSMGVRFRVWGDAPRATRTFSQVCLVYGGGGCISVQADAINRAIYLEAHTGGRITFITGIETNLFASLLRSLDRLACRPDYPWCPGR